MEKHVFERKNINFKNYMFFPNKNMLFSIFRVLALELRQSSAGVFPELLLK